MKREISETETVRRMKMSAKRIWKERDELSYKGMILGYIIGILLIVGGVSAIDYGTYTEINSTVIQAMNDSWVDEGSPTNNHGDSNGLVVGHDNSPAEDYRAWIMWNITNYEFDNIGRVTISSYSGGGDAFAIQSHTSTNDSWNAGTITWNNQPSFSATETDEIDPIGNAWQTWDISTFVKGEIEVAEDDFITIVLKTNETGTWDLSETFRSTEYDATSHPYLNITSIPYLNLTFDSSTNGTISSTNYDANWTGNNLTIRSDTLGEGIVLVKIGEYQFFRYENEEYSTGNWTHIEKETEILTSIDVNVPVVVHDGTDNVYNANVWVERFTDNEWKLIGGVFTDRYGVTGRHGIMSLESGYSYRFTAYHDDYTTTAYVTGIPFGYDGAIKIEVEAARTYSGDWTVSSTCTQRLYYINQTCTASVILAYGTTATNISFYENAEDANRTQIETGTNASITYDYNINDSTGSSHIIICLDLSCNFMISHDKTASVWTLPQIIQVQEENRALMILLILIICAMIGALADWLMPGVGMHTAFIVLGLFSATMGVLIVPLGIIALYAALFTGRKVIR